MNLPAKPPSPRAWLREATQRAHEETEAAFAGFDLTQRERYRAFLEQQAAVVLPLEHELDAVGADALLSDWARRKRSAALIADLHELDGVSRPVHPPVILNPASAWGMLYVLEGSRLGGRVLSSIVSRSDDPRARSATRFLRHGEGEQLWPSFVAALNAAIKTETEIAAAVDGAIATFALFRPGVVQTVAA
jgi:heme oxygenase